MTTLDRVFVYPGVLVAVILAAVGVHETRNMQPAGFRFAAAPPITVTFTYDTCATSGGVTKCTCYTAGSNGVESSGGVTYAKVSAGSYVIWKTGTPAPANNNISGQFLPQNSPFYTFSNSSGASTYSGQASGNNGDTFTYDSLTLNGNVCNNPGSLGLIMR